MTFWSSIYNELKSFFLRHKLPITCALLQWYFSNLLQIDRLFFIYENENDCFYLIKTLYLIWLVFVWCSCSELYMLYKMGHARVKRGFEIFITYLLISSVFLIILWPGTWAWDDIWNLLSERKYYMYVWQHIFTSIYQMLFLQILPFPGGIVLQQILLEGVCVAYIVERIEYCILDKHFSYKNGWLTIVKLLPFFLPPVISYQYSGYRMGVYVFLEAALLTLLITSAYEKERWSNFKLGMVVLLTAILANWRTEAIFYFPLLLFFYRQKREVLPLLKKVCACVCVSILFFGIFVLQKQQLKNSNYEIISSLRPLAEILKVVDRQKYKEELKQIGKVIKVDVAYSNPKLNGEALYWRKKIVRDKYTQEQYDGYKKAFFRLIKEYPKVVAQERWTLLKASSGFAGRMPNNTFNSATLFYKTKLNSGADRSKEAFQKAAFICTKPVLNKTREKFIRLLGCVDNKYRANGIFKVVWNHVIPLGFILVTYVSFVLKKKWMIVMVLSVLLLKFFIVALTQPSGWFMYYLSFYLIGYIILVQGVFYLFYKYKAKENLQG